MPALASIGYQFIEALKLSGSVTGVTFLHQVHDRAMSLKYRCAMASMLEGFVLSDARKAEAGVVADHPWSLAVGVIAENVQALSELEDCPSNGVAHKMWALLRAGVTLV
eukprot:6081187-Amphidinium_carterae.1